MSTSIFKWAALLLVISLLAMNLVPAAISVKTFDIEDETHKALEYIARREAVSVGQLVAVNQHRRDYTLLGKSYWAVTAVDTADDRWYSVMIDLKDSSFVDNIEKIEQAEQDAHFAKYGKLEPDLYEHLLLMRSDEEVQVAIWVAGLPIHSQDEIYALLASKYPIAKQTLQESGKPFAGLDPKLASQLESDYMAILAEDTRLQINPLLTSIQMRGYKVTTFDALPAIAVTLPKSVILEIAERNDIGRIYLVGRMQKSQLDTAVPTDLVPALWQLGYRGNGINIAILEAGKVDFTGPIGHNYLHQGQMRTCAQGEAWHKTFVASIAGSYHSTLTGVAPDATIVDACTNGFDSDTVSALSWALNPSSVINASITFSTNGTLHFTDKAFDHYARIGNDTIIVAAGNYDTATTYVSSPGLAWNVITVGAYNNLENADWSDDTMWSESKWRNPPSTDREKPEVVAPGVLISATELDNKQTTASGTSAAAPQVAGLAALLINRDTSLDYWPESLKAIIMASATHNIEGPTGIPTGQDLKDGAGGINAVLADTIARAYNPSETTPCTTSCWWGTSIGNNTNLPVGGYLYRYFTAKKGDFIRVAISWWSNVSCPDANNCSYDRLDTNLNLGAQFSNGSWVPGAWSASTDNNYELIEFVAPASDTYRIAVNKFSASETSNSLGIAVLRLHGLYLPLIQNSPSSPSPLAPTNPYPAPNVSPSSLEISPYPGP